MLRTVSKDRQASGTTLTCKLQVLLAFVNGFSCSSCLSSQSLCLTKAVTKISQLAWHAKHAWFLLKLLRTLRNKCQKLKQIVHALPELCQILQLCAALCWQPVPCAATEALRLLFSSGIFQTPLTSPPGCFVSQVIIKVCNQLLASHLQTSRKEFCSAVNFNCSFETGENWERLRKLSHKPTLLSCF